MLNVFNNLTGPQKAITIISLTLSICQIKSTLFLDIVEWLDLQENTRLPIMGLARKAADVIVNHRKFREVGFCDQYIEEEVLTFVGLDQLYKYVRSMYQAEFANKDYEHVSEYENIFTHPFKYLRVSYRLLQVFSLFPDLRIKLWSLIPQDSHSIVNVPLNDKPLKICPLYVTCSRKLMQTICLFLTRISAMASLF
ncbi:hypothetical protein BD560DRAFT_427785 [Blakeslea trispora]|nr:hypothetical protein BD560DRAFT_427785 [Blakeslea trispora]